MPPAAEAKASGGASEVKLKKGASTRKVAGEQKKLKKGTSSKKVAGEQNKLRKGTSSKKLQANAGETKAAEPRPESAPQAAAGKPAAAPVSETKGNASRPAGDPASTPAPNGPAAEPSTSAPQLSAARSTRSNRSSSPGLPRSISRKTKPVAQTPKTRRTLLAHNTKVDVDKVIRQEEREAKRSSGSKALEIKIDPRGQLGITFFGIHLDGMDAIRVSSVNRQQHGDKVKVGDELFAIDGEQIHGGLNHTHINDILEKRMLAKRASGFPVRLSLHRRLGTSHPSDQIGTFVPNMAKEYPTAEPDKRPYVFSADNGLMQVARSHLEAWELRLKDDEAQLQYKVDELTSEVDGQTAVATELMRMNRKLAFMETFNDLQRRRRATQKVISEFMAEPLHGPQRQRERAIKQRELVNIEAEIRRLVKARTEQLTAYSGYDCRSSLIKLNAQLNQIKNEKAAIEKSLERKHAIEDKVTVTADIEQLKQLEEHASRQRLAYRDNIYVKEIELDGILAEFEGETYGTVSLDQAEFPSKGAFWEDNKKSRQVGER